MGEAKRRKKLDKNFGRPPTIKLIERTELTDENLMELLKNQPIKWFGEISQGEKKQQCGLLPFNNSLSQGKRTLACRLLFAPPYRFKLNQKDIDRLRSLASRQIYERSLREQE